MLKVCNLLCIVIAISISGCSKRATDYTSLANRILDNCKNVEYCHIEDVVVRRIEMEQYTHCKTRRTVKRVVQAEEVSSTFIYVECSNVPKTNGLARSVIWLSDRVPVDAATRICTKNVECDWPTPI